MLLDGVIDLGVLSSMMATFILIVSDKLLLVLLDDGIVNTSFSIWRKCTIQVSSLPIA